MKVHFCKLKLWQYALLLTFFIFFIQLFIPMEDQRMTTASIPDVKDINKLALYYKDTCPFCFKVQQAMQEIGINHITLHSTFEETHLNTLISEGGKRQVPCLRIESDDQGTVWLYESDAIIDYLQRNFA